MTTLTKTRRLVIAGDAWRSDPPARVAIRKNPSMAGLLLWVMMLEEFCRRIQTPQNRHRRYRLRNMARRSRASKGVCLNMHTYPARD
jgi:hypothetical protein